MQSPIHPNNKIEYIEGDRVQFTVDGDVESLHTGTIVGIATRHIIDGWIIRLDAPIENWLFSCVVIQHTFIRPIGDNRPFLCEGFSRI